MLDEIPGVYSNLTSVHPSQIHQLEEALSLIFSLFLILPVYNSGVNLEAI